MTYGTEQARPLVTNGFKVALPETVEVIVRPLPDPKDVKLERERLAEHWFVHWFGGELYHLRLKNPVKPDRDWDNAISSCGPIVPPCPPANGRSALSPSGARG
jgi:hypothetical protein